MGISFFSSGSFDGTERWLTRVGQGNYSSVFDRAGRAGVAALARATPVRTGLTASSWAYRVTKTATGYSLEWYNTNVQNGSVIAILIQYGHGTGTGGFVQGYDYINPAIRPIFDSIVDDIVREVSP